MSKKIEQQIAELIKLIDQPYNKKQYQEAEALPMRACQLSEDHLGEKHPHTAQSLNNLAVALDAQGRSGEAEPFVRRALAIREQVQGSKHPDTTTSLISLAAVLSKQCHHDKAERLYRRTRVTK